LFLSAKKINLLLFIKNLLFNDILQRFFKIFRAFFENLFYGWRSHPGLRRSLGLPGRLARPRPQRVACADKAQAKGGVAPGEKQVPQGFEEESRHADQRGQDPEDRHPAR
jgi:hypothetical protein